MEKLRNERRTLIFSFPAQAPCLSELWFGLCLELESLPEKEQMAEALILPDADLVWTQARGAL